MLRLRFIATTERKADFGKELTQVAEFLRCRSFVYAVWRRHFVFHPFLAHQERKDIVNQVKAGIIDGLANGAVTEKSVAEALYTTPRNLHRKLQKEDTSFKQLLTDVRQDLAKQYIQDRSKTLTEISYMLGFSEVSSFSRAYKGWTGKPPSAARQDVA